MQNGQALASTSRTTRLDDFLQHKVRISGGAFRKRTPGEAMSAEEIPVALGFIRSMFGLSLRLAIGARPRLSSRELFALCSAVDDAAGHRERVVAVSALVRSGFHVSLA